MNTVAISSGQISSSSGFEGKYLPPRRGRVRHSHALDVCMVGVPIRNELLNSRRGWHLEVGCGTRERT